MQKIESEKSHRRGRPRSDSEGAREAYDVIHRYMTRESLSLNALALRCEMTPSTVARALADRESARWTPGFRRIYSIAENGDHDDKISPTMRRLASYEGPAEATVRRLLSDIEELVMTLSSSRR